MLKFLKYWFWDIDKAPELIGWIGFAIMGAFLVFCLGVLAYHEMTKPVAVTAGCRREASGTVVCPAPAK
jgi:uncharacterized integral membrane protein